MGTFDFTTPIQHINFISNESSLSMRCFPFHTLYFNDSWTLPSLAMSYEGHSHIGIEIPLSAVENLYQTILEAIADLGSSSSWKDELDPILYPIWVIEYSCSHDFLENTLPLDKSILEAMFGPDRPWDDMHHRSYFLLELVRIE
jgi:hypothetical protein